MTKNRRNNKPLTLRGRQEGLLGPDGPALAAGRAAATAVKKIMNASTSKKKNVNNSRSKKSAESIVGSLKGIPMTMSHGVRAVQPTTFRTGNCREFVTDLSTSSVAGAMLTLADLPINPGNVLLFPRLSNISELYEKYRFRRLRFTYVPVTNVTVSGFVGMYIDFDPDDAAVSSLSALMSNQCAAMSPPYEQFVLEVDCREPRWFYTSPDTADAANDGSRLEDLGVLRILADKLPANVALGYLLVDYDAEFVNQKPPTTLMHLSPYRFFSSTSSYTDTVTIGPNGSNSIVPDYRLTAVNTCAKNIGWGLEDHVADGASDASPTVSGLFWAKDLRLQNKASFINFRPYFTVSSSTAISGVGNDNISLVVKYTAPGATSSAVAYTANLGALAAATPTAISLSSALTAAGGLAFSAGTRFAVYFQAGSGIGSTSFRLFDGQYATYQNFFSWTVVNLGPVELGRRRRFQSEEKHSDPDPSPLNGMWTFPDQLDQFIALASQTSCRISVDTLSRSSIIGPVLSRTDEIQDYIPDRSPSQRSFRDWDSLSSRQPSLRAPSSRNG